MTVYKFWILFDGPSNISNVQQHSDFTSTLLAIELKLVCVKCRLQTGVECRPRVKCRLHADYSYNMHVQCIVLFPLLGADRKHIIQTNCSESAFRIDEVLLWLD